MKRNVLYIGNYLKDKKRNASYMFTLGKLLSCEGYALSYASGYTWKPLRLMHMLSKVFLKRKDSDYVLIDTYSTQNFYFAYLTARLCWFFKLPYIPILHGGNLPKRLQISPRLANTLFNNAFVNVSPSFYLKTAFEKSGYTNIKYIPNSFELSDYPFKKRAIDSIKLLWVRSFSEIYNPLLATKVLKNLMDKGYTAKLCMVGPDNDGSMSKVKQYAEVHGLDVKFTGKLTKKEWINVSNECNLFINTSNFDNMPVSVIEAMALGLPVVSTNVGGMPYLIDKRMDGLLVNPDNVKEMVDAILELYENNTFAVTVAKNARHKVEQYDWEVIKHQWFDVLE